MSWVRIDNEAFPYSLNRSDINKTVLNELIESGAGSQFSYNGSFLNIRFVDTRTYMGVTDASHAIESMQNRRDDNIAVPFYDFERSLSANKEIQALDKKIKELEKACRKADNESYLKNITSRLVTCRNCDSKIRRSFWGERPSYVSNFCPVCNADLRPDSTRDSIARKKAALRKAIDDKANLEKELTLKLSANPEKYAEKFWLVNASLYIG